MKTRISQQKNELKFNPWLAKLNHPERDKSKPHATWIKNYKLEVKQFLIIATEANNDPKMWMEIRFWIFSKFLSPPSLLNPEKK